MSLIQQTAIQLIVGVIAFLAGVFLQRIRAAWSYFNSRRFWRPLLRRDLALVLGDGFSGLRRFEASDVIGRGDLIASSELNTQFSRMGFRRLQPVFADRMIGDDLTGRPLRRSMIVLGGPDANSVSLRCLEGMEVSYKLIWPTPGDAEEPIAGTMLRPPRLVLAKSTGQNDESCFRPSVQGNDVVQDYGVIIRARNPFAQWGREITDPRGGRRVVIIYGCYGYGTLAAVLYSQTAEFLEMIENGRDDIECVVVCRVVMGTPQTISCVYFKAHPHGTLSRRLDGGEVGTES